MSFSLDQLEELRTALTKHYAEMITEETSNLSFKGLDRQGIVLEALHQITAEIKVKVTPKSKSNS